MITPTDYGVVDERTARVAWARLVESDDREAMAQIAEDGYLDAFHRLVRSARLPVAPPAEQTPPGGHPRGRQPLRERVSARLQTLDAARDVEIAARLGARIVIPEDDEWPAGLDDLTRPPACLWVKGPLQLAEVCRRSVAVVGARAATSYGMFLAGEIAGGLAARGFAIISGGAYGIDGAAHRAALAAEGITVGVLAGGVDRLYPPGHDELLRQVGATGLLVTESPPGSAPQRWRFLSRNRLIAAMAGGTLIVEAGLRSGARSTVREASELNRPVGAVPGPVTSMVSAGCHEIIRSGAAVLVTDAAEAAELFAPMGEELAPLKRGAEQPGDGLDEVGQRVFATLAPHHSVTVDEICRAAALEGREVLATLGQLQAAGIVERRLDGWGRVRPR